MTYSARLCYTSFRYSARGWIKLKLLIEHQFMKMIDDRVNIDQSDCEKPYQVLDYPGIHPRMHCKN